MHEQRQTRLVHHPALRERQRLTHEPSHTLPQRIIPALHMIRLPRLLPHRLMLLTRNHRSIRSPKVRVAQCPLVPPRHCPPQLSARALTTIPSDECHDLPSHCTQRDPHPTLMLLIVNKRPQLVQLENPLCWRGWFERCIQLGEVSRFFLIHFVTV